MILYEMFLHHHKCTTTLFITLTLLRFLLTVQVTPKELLLLDIAEQWILRARKKMSLGVTLTQVIKFVVRLLALILCRDNGSARDILFLTLEKWLFLIISELACLTSDWISNISSMVKKIYHCRVKKYRPKQAGSLKLGKGYDY